MSANRAEMVLAAGVAVRSVHAYLAAHGWEKAAPADMTRADVYRMAGREDAVLVPASADYADYALRIWQLAGDVEQVEGRPRAAILNHLMLATRIECAGRTSADICVIRAIWPSFGTMTTMTTGCGRRWPDPVRDTIVATDRRPAPRCGIWVTQ